MQAKEFQKTSKYDSLYFPADKYITYNDNDPELRPITIRLPDPPDVRCIEGYGLPPEQQKFRHAETPPRLKEVERSALLKAKEKHDGRMIGYMQQMYFWDALNENQESYQDEINFIKREHWRLRYGHWVWIFGKPYWIPPKHYFYLNYYYPTAVEGSKIDFRNEDREVKIYEEYCDTTTETFKYRDDNGFAVKNENDGYDLVDVGHRVCMGDAHPKRRRKGITMQNCSDGVYILITGKEKHVVIQANIGKAAEDIYRDHILPAWKNLPIWIKPVYDGNNDPAEGLFLKPPSSVIGEKYLDSWLVWNESAKEGVNDRRKLHYLLSDEEGKANLYDVAKRWAIDRLTLIQGTSVHGISRHPSTVEEMNEGGEFFMKMFMDSNFYRRDLVGMTGSGLFSLFRPVWKGWDNFIDEWGFSVTGTPTEAQLKNPPLKSEYHVLGMGSKEFWERKYDEMLSDPTKHADYRVEIRKHPMVSGDCWRGGSSDMGWDYLILDKALSDLRGRNDVTVRGNFIRRGDVVDFVQSDEGRFVVANLFLGQQNQFLQGDQVWNPDTGLFVSAKRPKYPSKFSIGADPFDYRSSGSKAEFHLSDGGIGVYHNSDPNEAEKPITEQESGQIVCYYEARPSLDVYCQDLLAVSIWFGGLVNLESNLKMVIKYFYDTGFGGYLWRATMPDGTFKKEPGTYSGAATKNEMLNALRDFVAYRAHKCKIKEFLNSAREIRDPKDLTYYDGLAACGWAIYAANSGYGKTIERFDDFDFDFDSLYGTAKRY